LKTLCPKCGAPGSELRICYPAWFKFEDTDGAVDASTLDTVDTEANAKQYCEACGENFDVKNLEHFADPSCPTLDEWVYKNAQTLERDIRNHLSGLGLSHPDVNEEDCEDAVRCIMISIRQYMERRT
jgi:hypothetical protein